MMAWEMCWKKNTQILFVLKSGNLEVGSVLLGKMGLVKVAIIDGIFGCKLGQHTIATSFCKV